ncbi:lysophospholipid acyltransferase family protein [Entomospira entomophila]|uniref:1-acyl-sn-glycerol-3-phosphate acyltransferase n=1 Tax=Entomospira entomophila TaxID=2719988 RepID=A0A968G9C8_9SPIO|nr:lysophospholipid acyltransferase family protein [Entomospira entomophilus]NIZ40327.1 1-acyl-sn-glycerol-3-phosphate acyltransferase [Entomospira entomophilus]WDI35886.1 lysophospholipid acyltransferase family protein [Entomospira entomophilus]
MRVITNFLGWTRFVIVFASMVPFTAVFLLVQVVLWLFRARKVNRLFAYYTLSWISRCLVRGQGVSVSVKGLEHIPKDQGVVFMVNHQEFSDILLCYGYLKTPMAMVAKKELGYIPGLSMYMRSLECYMLDRKNPKQALALFEKARKRIQEEQYSALIYPEGTRSRGPKNRDFMVGASRIAYLAQASIIPVTISGSWKAGIYIKQIGGKKHIDIVVHPLVDIKDYPNDKKQELMAHVQQAVESGFTDANKA